MYEDKEAQYYKHVRREILPLLPARCERVLEVGCGQGDTLIWIKKTQSVCQWIGGVELFAQSAAVAKQHLDWFSAGNIELLELPIEKQSLDVILCLDVLEHLVDPWRVVARLHEYLKPGGVIIASIPNVRYFKVSLGLFFKGTWRYEQEGILDRTHLRFFTKQTAIELMQSSGLQCDAVIGKGVERGRKAYLPNLLTLGLLRPFFEFQYLIRVVKR
jgi:2-polyprenyl-3-methyl-5-hydroxy-6-metoxy-1,4-benzoquinol methylase